MLKFRRYFLLSVCWAGLGGATVHAETYVWNGLGILGGTEGTNWLDAGNWLTNGIPAGAPPTSNDTVTVTFNSNVTARPVPILVIPDGATGGDVTIGGGGNLPNYGVHLGNCSLGSIFFNLAANNKVRGYPGALITVFGGSAASPSFKQGTGWDLGTIGGAFLFTGSNVFITTSTKSLVGQIVFTNPVSTINWLGSYNQTMAGGFFRFLPTQTFVTSETTPPLLVLNGGAGSTALQSLDPAQPLLTNLAAIHVDATIPGGSGGFLYFAGGTFRSLIYRYAGNDNNNFWSQALGDIVIQGGRTYADTFITNYSLCVYRSTTKLNVKGGLSLGGFDLTVKSTSPVHIGNPGAGGGRTNASVLAMADSTLSAAGDFIVGLNGVLTGNEGSLLKVGGNLVLLTDATAASFFVMSNAAVVLNGQGSPENPQELEVHSTAGLGPVGNFAFGSLWIGEEGQPTRVRLVDDAGTNETLYLTGQLGVTNGSVLDFGGISVTAEHGVLAAGAVTGSGTVDGNLAFQPAGSLEPVLIAPASFEPLAVNGTVTLAGSLIVTADASHAIKPGDEYLLIANDGSDPVAGAFANWPHNATQTVDGHSIRLLTNGGDGNDVVLKAVSSGGAIWLLR